MTRVGCLAQCGHNNDSRCSLTAIDIEFNDEGELICLMQDFVNLHESNGGMCWQNYCLCNEFQEEIEKK